MPKTIDVEILQHAGPNEVCERAIQLARSEHEISNSTFPSNPRCEFKSLSPGGYDPVLECLTRWVVIAITFDEVAA